MEDARYIQNYNKYMESVIATLQQHKQVPRLLLHSCCAPCSSAVLERLTKAFAVTVFYYNPNIEPQEEYCKRVAEQQRLIREFPAQYPVSFLEGQYDPAVFHKAVKGLETSGEGGSRCYRCYQFRLRETARIAKEQGFAYMTTTLSVSPFKNAKWLNEIGCSVAKEVSGVEYLYSDFKKKEGYKRSIALSGQYNLYRQDYCGCVYSKKEREEEKKRKQMQE